MRSNIKQATRGSSGVFGFGSIFVSIKKVEDKKKAAHSALVTKLELESAGPAPAPVLCASRSDSVSPPSHQHCGPQLLRLTAASAYAGASTAGGADR